MEGTEFSLEGRVLCSDGACIGTIGSDGRCKVCGKTYEGREDLSALQSLDVPSPLVDKEESVSDESMESESAPAADCDPSERVCCPDDTCIGIIGADGRCGTCGKKP